MAAPSPTRTGLSLEEFLSMPEIEEAPYWEYLDGRAEAKAMPTRKHGLLATAFTNRLNDFALPRGLGLAGSEVRHTYSGRSIVPDVSFSLAENVAMDPDGTPSDKVVVPPDIHIEILSPDQSAPRTVAKLAHSTAHGCSLGMLVDPDRRTIDVYRPDRPAERLADDAAIDFAPVLPGLVVPVAEVFSWMVVRWPRRGDGGE